jgi:hypothetical protein
LALAERALAGLSDYLAQAGHYECFQDRIDQAIPAGEADPTLDPG